MSERSKHINIWDNVRFNFIVRINSPNFQIDAKKLSYFLSYWLFVADVIAPGIDNFISIRQFFPGFINAREILQIWKVSLQIHFKLSNLLCPIVLKLFKKGYFMASFGIHSSSKIVNIKKIASYCDGENKKWNGTLVHSRETYDRLRSHRTFQNRVARPLGLCFALPPSFVKNDSHFVLLTNSFFSAFIAFLTIQFWLFNSNKNWFITRMKWRGKNNDRISEIEIYRDAME